MIPKFRAWQREEDEEYSRMIRSEQSVLTAIRHVYGGAGIATGSGFSDINNKPEPGRYELMQSTGLFDVNGKEIFESDILKCTSFDGSIWYETVLWDSTLAGFATQQDGYDATAISYTTDSKAVTVEIIGNIYENPELVEELK